MDVKLGDVLEGYGLGEFAQVHYGWNRTRCPFHDDSTPSASVNYEEGRFYCFVCDINEDALGLIMRLENVDFKRAKEIARTRFGAEDEEPQTRRRRRGSKRSPERRRIRVRRMGVDS